MRVLDNKWVSRAGNLSFVAGIVIWVVHEARHSAGDPVQLVTLALVVVGVLLMVLPHARQLGLRDGRGPVLRDVIVQIDRVERKEATIEAVINVAIHNSGRRGTHGAIQVSIPQDVAITEVDEKDLSALNASYVRNLPDYQEPIISRGERVPTKIWVSSDRLMARGYTQYWFRLELPRGGRIPYEILLSSDDVPKNFIHKGELHI